MNLPLQIASTVLKAALLIGLLSGLGAIWIPNENNDRVLEVLRNILWSSVLLVLVTSMYIAVCGVLARIERNSKRNSTTPGDE